jgi:glycosyltransferase involved in cell wall biosynthesis
MYNVAQYLEKCIGSVYSQELNEDEFEVVLVNDASPDNSLAVATNVTKNKNNVKIISQENKGLGGARNTGIRNATGNYLLFLDADDWLLPNVLEELLAAANNDDLDILEFAAQGISSKEEILYHITNKSEVYLSGYEYYNNVRYMNSACNKLYKRTFLLENELFFLEKIYIEDFEFNTRCLTKVKKIKATNKLAAQFLQSENSITRSTDISKKKKMIADIILVIKKTDYLYKKEGKNYEESSFYLERLNFLVATLFYQLIKNKATYEEISTLKLNLQQENIFYINHTIFDFKKNLLRIIVLKNLWSYKLFSHFLN